MQNFGVTSKQYYGMLWHFLEWSKSMVLCYSRLSRSAFFLAGVSGVSGEEVCVCLRGGGGGGEEWERRNLLLFTPEGGRGTKLSSLVRSP